MKKKGITILNKALFAFEIYKDAMWFLFFIIPVLGLSHTVVGDMVEWMAIPMYSLFETKFMYISVATMVIFWIERLNIKKLAEIGLSEKMIKAIKIISILSVINTPFQVFMIYISRF